MSDLIDRFLVYKETKQGCSPLTLAAYETDLRGFVKFLVGLEPEFDPNSKKSWARVTIKIIDRFVLQLKNFKYKATSINRKLSAIRTFYDYLSDQGFVEKPLMPRFIVTNTVGLRPTTISASEFQLIFDAAVFSDSPLRERDLAIISLLYLTGLRNSELIGLDVGDLELSTVPSRLTCHGRQNRQRTLVLTGALVQLLNNYLKKRNSLVKDTTLQALFISRYGLRLTRSEIWSVVTRHRQLAGISVRVNPRILRHSFTARTLSAGKTLGEVQQLLDHSNRATTRRYRKLVEQV